MFSLHFTLLNLADDISVPSLFFVFYKMRMYPDIFLMHFKSWAAFFGEGVEGGVGGDWVERVSTRRDEDSES